MDKEQCKNVSIVTQQYISSSLYHLYNLLLNNISHTQNSIFTNSPKFAISFDQPNRTMPKQGPGTKLVLKALARAFPDIAEQRAREEREWREEQERLLSSKRKHTSHHNDTEDRQVRSTHSRSGQEITRTQTRAQSRREPSSRSHAEEDLERGESNRPESIRRGPSMRTSSRDAGYRSQSRGQSRMEGTGREVSTYRSSRDPGEQSRSRGASRAESTRRGYSNDSDGSYRYSTRG